MDQKGICLKKEVCFFTELANEEQKPDQGWSNANMFSNILPSDSTQEVIDINIWPTSKPGNVVTEQVQQYDPAVSQYSEQSVETTPIPVDLNSVTESVEVYTEPGIPNSSLPVQSPEHTTPVPSVTSVNIGSVEGTHKAYYSPNQNRIVIVSNSGGSQICTTPNTNTVYQISQKTEQSKSLLHDIVRLTGTSNSSFGAGQGVVQVETTTRGRGRGPGRPRGGGRGRGRGRGRGKTIISGTGEGTFKIVAPQTQPSPRSGNLLLHGTGGPTAGSFAGYTIPKIKQPFTTSTGTFLTSTPSSGSNSIITSLQDLNPGLYHTDTVANDSDGESVSMLDHGYAIQMESAVTQSVKTSVGQSSCISTSAPNTSATYNIVHQVHNTAKVVSDSNRSTSALKSALLSTGDARIIRVESLPTGSQRFTVTTSSKTPNKDAAHGGQKVNPVSISKVVKIPLHPGIQGCNVETGKQQTSMAGQTVIQVSHSGQQQFGMKIPTYTMAADSPVTPDVNAGAVVCADDSQQNEIVVNSEDGVASQNSSQSSGTSDSSSGIPPSLLTAAITNNLKAGQNYIIDHGNGVQKSMIWNGNIFIEDNGNSNHLSGGGAGDGNGEKVLKGNTTGLNMLAKKKVGRPRKSDEVILPNGRTFIHTSYPSDKYLGRPPIHPMQNHSLGGRYEGDAENSAEDDSSQGENKMEDTSSVKRQNEDDGEYVVHCKFCGYTSARTDSCERCNRKFPNNVKKEPVKRQKLDSSESKNEQSTGVVTKDSFYGKKIQGQSQPYKSAVLSVRSVSQRGRRINNQGRTYNMVRITPSKKYVEPVTVIVSSDEEEDTATQIANLENLSTSCVQTPSKNGSSSALSCNESKNQSNTVSKKTEEDDELSKLVSIIPSRNSPTFKNSRISKMEDKEGNLMSKWNTNTQSNTPSPEPLVKVDTPKPVAIPLQSQSSGSLTLNARSVKVGSLKGTPIEPILISDDGVQIFMECEENTHKFNIAPSEMNQCLLHLKKSTPVIFIHTTVDFGGKLRKQLEMTNKTPPPNSSEPYFNPVDKDLKYQYIVLLLQSVSLQEQKNTLRVLEGYQQTINNKDQNFIEMLSHTESQQLLISTSFLSKRMPNPAFDMDTNAMKTEPPCVNNTMTKSNNTEFGADNSDMDTSLGQRERSPSPPRIMFSGPIEKLITYPPPPTPGGIAVTNEDLYCLNEGEFLNDVIIDFYLRFLFREVLSEEVRKRTHIFSSFFFKRLTQRQGRVADSALTPAERRHAAVKKWTKHVDLFEKDFIVIPINEHSHWFLAIICYPGLLMNENIFYIPKHRLEKVFGEQVSTPVQQDSEGLTDSMPTPGSDNAGEAMEEDVEENNEEKPMDTETTPTTSVPQTTMSTPTSTPVSTPITMPQHKTQYTPAYCSSTKVPPKELRGRIIQSYDEVAESKKCFVESGQRAPCVLIFDSLAGPNKARIVTILKEYLQVEWNTKKDNLFNLKERIRGCTPRVPQQTNFSDCGLYVLQYAQSFFEDPLVDYSFPIKCLQNWFTEERMKKKRQEIKDLVMAIKQKNDAELLKKLQHLQHLKQQQLQQQQTDNDQAPEEEKECDGEQS
ncbi:sentrin-specific protease 6-like [Ylistrum balloti]|uniref:sentrin-specific protease 6-like n=1 Tax=Ylistrum balloti TaxID=509963 RepID=UPI002905A4DB|nr:sentrin-specific protease 6-like [Ylistrum balloti]